MIPDSSEAFKEAFTTKKAASQVVDLDIMFSERMDALPAIHNEFAATGTVVSLPATTDAEALEKHLANAVKKTWVALVGLPESGAKAVSEYINATFPGSVVECPSSSEAAAALVAAGGAPKLSLYFKASVATCCDRAAAAAAAAESDFDAEAFTATAEAALPLLDGIIESGILGPVTEFDGEGEVSNCFPIVADAFTPSIYLVVCPKGRNLSRLVGVQACSKLNGGMLCDAQKLVVDAASKPDAYDSIYWPELAAHGSGVGSVSPVSASLYAQLMKDFVNTNTNASSFVVINYINDASTTSYPAVRDLFDVLPGSLEKVIYCDFTESPVELSRLSTPENTTNAVESMAYISTAVQNCVTCAPSADDVDGPSYAKRVCSGFKA